MVPCIRRLLLLTLLCIPTFTAVSAPSDAADTATVYLKAWAYKDYATMRDLAAPDVRQELGESEFYKAARQLPAPAQDPRIVERVPRAGGQEGEVVYFEFPAGGEQPAGRGSIIVGPGGIAHPELEAAASPDTPSVGGDAAAGDKPGKTVDGLTAEGILQKMQKASEQVKTLQGPVAIRGSMLGTTVNEEARLAFMAPDRISLKSKSFVMNSNGERNILYLPEANIYMDLTGLGEFELTPGLGTSVEEMQEKYKVALLGKDELDGQTAYRLSLNSPASTSQLPLGLGAGGGRMTLWVSADTWLPLRASVSGMTVDYSNLQINADGIDETTFDFKPPKGASAFSLGGLMGALGGAGAAE